MTVADGVDVSVVVPTWNGADRITDTLGSLLSQTLPSGRYEVIVVDDGSTDDTRGIVERFDERAPALQLRYVRQPHSGVNAARNTGILNSTGRVVCFIDDDEDAPSFYLERAIDLLATDERFAGVGGPAIVPDHQRFRVCSRCPAPGETGQPIRGRGPTPKLHGGNMAVRRELFEEVGLFDAEISGRGDESEWFRRAQRTFLYDEQFYVWHRREHMSLSSLLVTGFRQGKSIPLLRLKVGDAWRPSPVTVLVGLAHAARRRCVHGLLRASRQCGAIVGWIRLQTARRRRPAQP